MRPYKEGRGISDDDCLICNKLKHWRKYVVDMFHQVSTEAYPERVYRAITTEEKLKSCGLVTLRLSLDKEVQQPFPSLN
ncbi:MAG TPA: hypothetical protein VH878_02695 [Thermodesulfobacteriota bacterium]|jgi:hypothetical protein